MIYIRLGIYVVLIVFSYFSGDFVFAATLIGVLAILDYYLTRVVGEGKILPYLLATTGWFLVALVILLTISFTDVEKVLVLAGAGYLSLISGRLVPCMMGGQSMSPSNVIAGIKCSKILDASILMDGRIVDIVEAGFLEGTMVVPRFVMQQIYHLSETGSELKQQRAQHALELIRKLQNMKNIHFRICEIDFPHEKDIDHRMIALAEKLKAKIITNDYTLNRVASLEEIEVLNINELANALKPVALPGEKISIHLLKKGKEPDQGVGYLDDGTMVVIDGGEPFIGERVDALITSVLQNPAGKMIFGKVGNDEV